jgi:hypothetical protein
MDFLKGVFWFALSLGAFVALQIWTDGAWDEWTDRIFGT